MPQRINSPTVWFCMVHKLGMVSEIVDGGKIIKGRKYCVTSENLYAILISESINKISL